VLVVVALVVDRHRERKASRQLAEDLGNKHYAALAQVLEEVTSLREALLSSGAVERRAKPPDPPSPSRPAPDETPSTKPVQSREVPAAPTSVPRPVPEDQIQRAMRRIERHAKVPPPVQARWEQRLRALGDELRLTADDEPSDSQLNRVVRELYEAEADVKDARPAAPPLEATLASATSPIATLPRPNADDESEDGRDTGEDMTKVFSKDPRAADAQIPGVEVKPATAPPPPRRPPHPLAGVEPERPTASATRTAEAFRKRTTLQGIAPNDDKGGEA
jgi:hypothetical protein